MKNVNEWIEEAESFKDEFFNSTGHYPELDDIIAECEDIAKDRESRETMENLCGTVENYAKELYSYM